MVDERYPRFAFQNLCRPRAWCLQNMLTFAVSLISMTAVTIVLIRIGLRRAWKRRGADTSIGGLVEYLVVVLCVIDLCYHFPDIIFSIDLAGAPLFFLLRQGHLRPFNSTMLYQYAREGLGLLSLLWHITIAYVMYSWLVLKHSASRLRRRRLWLHVLAAISITTARFMFFSNWGHIGLWVSVVLYDILFLPFLLLMMTRYYYLTVKALQGGPPGPPSPLRPVAGGTNLSFATSRGSQGGGTDYHSSDGTHMMSAQRRWVDGRYRPIILRLLRISVAIGSTWLIATSLDAITWLGYLITGRPFNRELFITRIVFLRSVGLIDAIILGGLCECRTPDKNSPSSGDDVEAATSSEEVTLQDQAAAAAAKDPLSASKKKGIGEVELAGIALARKQEEGGKQGMEGVRVGDDDDEEDEDEEDEDIAELELTMEPAVPIVLQPPTTGLGSELPSGRASIFVTTWNMGGCVAAEVEKELKETGGGALKDWIPRTGYDLYVVACQECLCFSTMRKLVQEFLGGPEEWALFYDEIGDTRVLHGKIAVMVLAKVADIKTKAFSIRQGSVNRVAAGVKLGPVRAANKGMVGLSVRWHDTSIAIMTAHFASDSKGRNRVARRNADASKMLKQLSLLWDQAGFEAHTQHHHAILLGDLNYRVLAKPQEVLELVQSSAQAMAPLASPPPTMLSGQTSYASSSASSSPSSHHAMASATPFGWRPLSYSRFFKESAVTDTTGLSTVPPSVWSWVCRLDELSQCMAQRLVFWNWQEGRITFPPSYRWERGAWAADFTNMDVLASSYSTAVIEHAHGGSGGVGPSHLESPSDHQESSPAASTSTAHTVTPRTPSYTDRILTHSLPACRGGLSWLHYDSVDCVTISDHRPVAAALQLCLDRDVIISEQEEAQAAADIESGGGVDHDTSVVYTIIMSKLKLVGGPVATSPREVSVVFPLVSEDSLAFLRIATALDEVMPGPRYGAPTIDPSLLNSYKTFLWGSDLRLSVLAHRTRSQHMLIRLTDRRGSEIGQGVIPLDYGMMTTTTMTMPGGSSTSGSSMMADEPPLPGGVAPLVREIRTELTSGGAYRGTLLLRLSVKQSSVSSATARRLSTASSHSSAGGGGISSYRRMSSSASSLRKGSDAVVGSLTSATSNTSSN